MHFNPLLILLGLTVAASVYAWSNPGLMSSWILDPYEMNQRGNQWYRFLTSGFLHADIGHLAFNMLAFYSFGRIVLSSFTSNLGSSAGTIAFLVLYLGGIVLSDLPTYFRHRHDPGYRSLGASGGVASVLFAGILFVPLASIGMMFLPPQLSLPGFIWGFLYLAYSYYMGRRQGDHINHDAHFYGALYGVLLTVILIPGVFPEFLQQVLAYRPQFMSN